MAINGHRNNKYNAETIWVDKKTLAQVECPIPSQRKLYYCLRSQLEYKTLIMLRNTINNKHKISVHPKIKIADFTDLLPGYKNCNFWKPDFIVTFYNKSSVPVRQVIIEAKGRVLQPFPYQYALCRQKYPKISIYVIYDYAELPRLVAILKDMINLS